MTARIGILVVAYNAASTLAPVLDRIPVDFRPRIERILVGDDHSADATYLVGLGYREVTPDLPIEVIRHPRNLGYGGNQKVGYRWALEQGLDIVILLHADAQYAPEYLPSLAAPLLADEADAVFGSRMLTPGSARRGGMPRYKYLGNRVLSRFENTAAGASLSEWHSGYRAYRVDALAELPFDRNDDGFNFDTQMTLQLIEAGKRISEVPIPTYYGDEICYVEGVRYARDVSRDVVRYRAHKMGLGTGELAFASGDDYELKQGEDTSHRRLRAWLAHRQPGRVLDLGCADGALTDWLGDAGHHVTGVDRRPRAGVGDRVDEFIAADLDDGMPPGVTGPFDVVVAADVLEHVRAPRALLAEVAELLTPDGAAFVSIPNFGHWYPRLRVAAGRFDYDRRGILDADHVRFFTKHSFERMVAGVGLSVRRREGTGVPLEVVGRGGAGAPPDADAAGHRGPNLVRRAVARADRMAVGVRPQLFAYQFLYELTGR